MFGDRLKLIRTSMKLTQVEFGKMLNVTKQTVSNWENNEGVPGIDTLRFIAEKCDVTTDYLLELDDRLIIDVNDLPIQIVTHIQQVINDMKRLALEGDEKNDKNSHL